MMIAKSVLALVVMAFRVVLMDANHVQSLNFIHMNQGMATKIHTPDANAMRKISKMFAETGRLQGTICS